MFTFFMVRAEGADPSLPLTISLTVKYPFFLRLPFIRGQTYHIFGFHFNANFISFKDLCKVANGFLIVNRKG